MRIAVLGTGMVGRAHAARLSELGHDVVMGTRDVRKKLAEKEADDIGIVFSSWHRQHNAVKLASMADAAKHGELVIEALHGEAAVGLLKPLEAYLAGKVLVDISNALDFSKGMPPSLFVCSTDSLGEMVQRALPMTKVVKSCNTVNADLQVNPKALAGGDHSVFMSGNDEGAKAKVREILEAYGWEQIIDLGDITTARGAEMLLPIWLRLWQTLKSPLFSFKVVKK